MNKKIKEEIFEILNPEKVEFQKKIIKTNYEILGSSVPQIRKLAIKLSNEISLEDLKSQEPDIFYEEVLLRGFIIAYIKLPISEKYNAILNYLDLVDDWSLIDSFSSTFKIKKSEKKDLFNFLVNNFKSEKEFNQRFSLVMLLSHFLKFDKNLSKLSRPKYIDMDHLNTDAEGQYISIILDLINREYKYHNSSMAASWLGAEAFLFYPNTVIEFLKNNKLDIITHNRLIQKITESKIPSKEVKDYVRQFKRT